MSQFTENETLRQQREGMGKRGVGGRGEQAHHITATYVRYIFLVHIILLQRAPCVVINYQLLYSFLWSGRNVFLERGGQCGTGNIFVLFRITILPEWQSSLALFYCL